MAYVRRPVTWKDLGFVQDRATGRWTRTRLLASVSRALGEHRLIDGICASCGPVQTWSDLGFVQDRSGRWVESTVRAGGHHYNPGQLRDPGGEGGGRWVKSPGAASEPHLLTGQAAIDATPAKLLSNGYPPRHEQFKPGELKFSAADPGWSPAERGKRVAALQGYQGEDFTIINRQLRGMATDGRYLDEYARSNGLDPAHAREHLDQQVGFIDDVMDASALTGDIRVLRGTQTGRGVFGTRLDGDLTGFEWTEDSYVSTTAGDDVEDFTRSGLSMEIAVPAGVKAVNLSGFTTGGGAQDEAEILLDRGLRMRVVGDTGPGNPRHLKVEVIDG